MNALMVINCYRSHGMWVFDDEARSLSREPFVAGTPEILDKLRELQGIKDDKFNIIFGLTEFPGYQARADWMKEEADGNWYAVTIDNKLWSGWLCPALLKFFPSVPKKIYIQLI